VSVQSASFDAFAIELQASTARGSDSNNAVRKSEPRA
jgi:hypothetical protein